MESNSKLIWVSLSLTRDDRERRLLNFLTESMPIVAMDRRDIANRPVDDGDLIILNFRQHPIGAGDLIETLLATAPKARILIRCPFAERPIELFQRFESIGLLDADEGPDLTRARLARALAEGRAKIESVPHPPEWRSQIKGRSHAIKKIAETIALVGPRRCTVLITGETGTGKEVIARAIHAAGPRSSKPFVALNCGAIPAALLETELFGHTRGAFTGAVQGRVGRFEMAEGGTLFLDEIGDMPFELQAKLLRVLQEREIQRVGSSETVKVNARIVAATNCSLPAKVIDGTFREDLYYRLNVVPLETPPLRTRPSDILPLAEHFLQCICSEERIPLKKMTPRAIQAMEQYSWPGNVRQLENAVASAAILSGERPVLEAEDFSFPLFPGCTGEREAATPIALPASGLNFTQTVSALERNLLSQALRKTGGNKKAAADMLQLKRTTLSAKIRVLELTEGVA